MEKKYTKNMREIYAALSELKGQTGFVYDILEKLGDGRTLQSISSTLTTLTTRKLVEKKKSIYKGTKLLTQYTLIGEMPAE
jgi:hypothetical protein